jgi:SAM-dependent methyltransferase
MSLRRLQANWNAFGKTDPLWAILTDPAKKGGGWAPEEFFATGEREIAGILDYVRSLHPLPVRRALDFGCGVGRLAQALAGQFDAVDGVDIAPSMIELARRYNRFGERCMYHVNARKDLKLFADNRFDFVYSNITLQHIEPRFIKRYVEEFVRVLAPGGVLLFQLPSQPVSRRDRLVERLIPRPLLRRYRHYYFQLHNPGQPRMEMHGVRRMVVERLLKRRGARLLDVQPDGCAAEAWVGFRYCATK